MPPWLPSMFRWAKGFPVVLETVTQGFTQDLTPDVNLPSTVNAGELLVLFVTVYRGEFAVITLTGPSGWSTLYNASIGGGHYLGAVFYKVANGTEGGSTVVLTVNATGQQAVATQVWRISGASASRLAASAASTSATAETHDAPAVTAPWGEASNLFVPVYHCNNDAASLTVAPANYGSIVNSTGGAGTDLSCTCATARRNLRAASGDPGLATFSEAEATSARTVVIGPPN